MKKCLTSLLAALFLSPCIHAAEYWMSAGAITWKPDGSPKVPFASVDVTTIVDNEADRKAWMYIVTVEDQSVVKLAGIRLSFRCDQSEYAPLLFVDYEPESLQIKSTTPGESKPSYESAIPGTLFDSTLKFVCGQRRGQPIEGEKFLFGKITGDDLSKLKMNALLIAEFARLDHNKLAPKSTDESTKKP